MEAEDGVGNEDYVGSKKNTGPSNLGLSDGCGPDEVPAVRFGGWVKTPPYRLDEIKARFRGSRQKKPVTCGASKAMSRKLVPGRLKGGRD